MNVEATPELGSFLLQFQESHTGGDDLSVACGTQTVTMTSNEARDQDPYGHGGIICGTQTGTKTIEGPDQDPWLLGTQTLTEAREIPEQDPPRADYFAIPRA